MNHQAAIKRGVRKWSEAGHNNSFRTDVNAGEETHHVHIYHHETFPGGGQAFTLDLNPNSENHTLIERRRVILVNGQETLLQR